MLCEYPAAHTPNSSSTHRTVRKCANFFELSNNIYHGKYALPMYFFPLRSIHDSQNQCHLRIVWLSSFESNNVLNLMGNNKCGKLFHISKWGKNRHSQTKRIRSIDSVPNSLEIFCIPRRRRHLIEYSRNATSSIWAAVCVRMAAGMHTAYTHKLSNSNSVLDKCFRNDLAARVGAL